MRGKNVGFYFIWPSFLLLAWPHLQVMESIRSSFKTLDFTLLSSSLMCCWFSLSLELIVVCIHSWCCVSGSCFWYNKAPANDVDCCKRWFAVCSYSVLEKHKETLSCLFQWMINLLGFFFLFGISWWLWVAFFMFN